jgi:hypothetical protein
MQVNYSGHVLNLQSHIIWLPYQRAANTATSYFSSAILIKFHSAATASTKIDISHEVVLEIHVQITPTNSH